MTVVYDLVLGQLIWVDHGRTSNVLIDFFEQLSPQTRDGIQAVSIDIGQSYQSVVRKALLNTDIVFNRFHVMQNYSLLIRKEHNKVFRKGMHDEKKCLRGRHFYASKMRRN